MDENHSKLASDSILFFSVKFGHLANDKLAVDRTITIKVAWKSCPGKALSDPRPDPILVKSGVDVVVSV